MKGKTFFRSQVVSSTIQHSNLWITRRETGDNITRSYRVIYQVSKWCLRKKHNQTFNSENKYLRLYSFAFFCIKHYFFIRINLYTLVHSYFAWYLNIKVKGNKLNWNKIIMAEKIIQQKICVEDSWIIVRKKNIENWYYSEKKKRHISIGKYFTDKVE